MEIDALIEAKMFLITALGRNDEGSMWTTEQIYDVFGVSNEEELMEALICQLSSLSIDLDVWYDNAIARKAYKDKCQHFYDQGAGFPINVPLFKKIIRRSDIIVQSAISTANEVIPGLFYMRNGYIKIDRAVLDKEFPDLKKKDVSSIFSDLKNLPIYESVYNAKMTKDQLLGKTGKALPHLLTNDGYIKGGYTIFEQKTGRNTPKPSEGFILNCHPWLRHIIKPKKGKAFLKLDWVGQEQWVAAVMTEDKKLLAGYQSGDIYAKVGIEMGLMPAGSDKHSHPVERTLAKNLQLAITYGMGEASLNRCLPNGGLLLDQHKVAFPEYWSWILSNQQEAIERQYYSSKDGWLYFVPKDTKVHRILNAPIQIEAAGMMRKVIMSLNPEIDMVASHFDALYISCDEEIAENTMSDIKIVMDLAAMDYFNVEHSPFIESEIFTNDKPYYDARGIDFFNRAKEIALASIEKELIYS